MRTGIPSGWQQKPLHEVAEVRTGVAKGKTGLRDPIELPYLRVANVQDGRIDLSSVKKIAVERNQVARYRLNAGDVLMTEGGDFDKLGRGDVWLGQIEQCLHQNHVFAVRPRTSILDPFFLASLASSSYGRTYFLGCAKRSTNLASINASQLRSFPVLLPPIGEQRKIAEILRVWEKAIAATEKLLSNSRLRQTALMRRLLTGRGGADRRSNEWRELPISQIADRVQRKSDGASYPILTISATKGFLRQDEKYSRYMAGASVEDYTLLQNGEFAYNKGNSKTYQFGCVVPLEGYDQALVPHVYVCFRLKPGFDGGYYRYLFESDYLRPQLGRVVNTGVRNNGLLNIKPSEFMAAKVPVPPLAEQKKIARILGNASHEMRKLNDDLENLKLQKKALLQLLLTGKRRVKLNEAT